MLWLFLKGKQWSARIYKDSHNEKLSSMACFTLMLACCVPSSDHLTALTDRLICSGLVHGITSNAYFLLFFFLEIAKKFCIKLAYHFIKKTRLMRAGLGYAPLHIQGCAKPR